MIFIRPHCSSLSSEILSRPSLQRIRWNSPSEFVERIQTILHREESLPQLTISSSTNISDSDFEENILKFMKIFFEEYFQKQEKARIELENKQKYLHQFQQTQLVAQQELDIKLQRIQQTFQNLHERYQRVISNLDERN